MLESRGETKSPPRDIYKLIKFNLLSYQLPRIDIGTNFKTACLCKADINVMII